MQRRTIRSCHEEGVGAVREVAQEEESLRGKGEEGEGLCVDNRPMVSLSESCTLAQRGKLDKRKHRCFVSTNTHTFLTRIIEPLRVLRGPMRVLIAYNDY